MKRTYDLMQHGIAGLVYGRNVIQHASPGKRVRALMAIVHDGAGVEQAMMMVG